MRSHLPGILVLLVVLGIVIMLLSGCTAGSAIRDVPAVTGAGVSTLDTEVVLVPEGQSAATEWHISLGKEYDELSLTVRFEDGSPVRVDVHANQVRGFVGQAQAQAALVAIQRELGEQWVQLAPTVRSGIRAAVLSFAGIAPVVVP